jgi:hypothetical protein
MCTLTYVYYRILEKICRSRGHILREVGEKVDTSVFVNVTSVSVRHCETGSPREPRRELPDDVPFWSVRI